jgi:hypothetical protein
MTQPQQHFRLFYFTAEAFPTFRADVAALFGKWLARRGISSDIVATRAPPKEVTNPWAAVDVSLCSLGSVRALKHVRLFLRGLAHAIAAPKNKYAAFQVRDLPLMTTAVLAPISKCLSRGA